jgi:hypothetical protein
MLCKVVKVRALPDHHLEIEFEDGLPGVLDYSHVVWGPVFEPLRDPARWAEVGIDEEGVVFWPNGADLAPDTMYERLKAQTTAAR